MYSAGMTATVIENLYDAFGDVPKPTRIEGCLNGCCMTTEEGSQLLSQPIRKADPELIRLFANDAMMTVGDAASFKYYVPRVLELCATGENVILMPESYFKRMREAGYHAWRSNQQDAVVGFLLERANRLGEFHAHSNGRDMDASFDLESWLMATCFLGADCHDLLEVLDAPNGQETKRQLLYCHYESFTQRRMTGPWWDDIIDSDQTAVLNWVISQDDFWRQYHADFGLEYNPPAP